MNKKYYMEERKYDESVPQWIRRSHYQLVPFDNTDHLRRNHKVHVFHRTLHNNLYLRSSNYNYAVNQALNQNVCLRVWFFIMNVLYSLLGT